MARRLSAGRLNPATGEREQKYNVSTAPVATADNDPLAAAAAAATVTDAAAAELSTDNRSRA